MTGTIYVLNGQSQILFILSSLAFCKKFDKNMLRFWNDTNLLESNLKSVKTGNRDPQFQQALIHLISCMVEAATATKTTKEKEDGSKEESKKQNEEEEKKEE